MVKNFPLPQPSTGQIIHDEFVDDKEKRLLDQRLCVIEPLEIIVPKSGDIDTREMIKMYKMENGDKRVSLNTSNEDLDSQIRLLMEKSENAAGERQKDGKARICKVCGKEGPMINIRNHIEAIHISGFSHDCSICGTTVKTRHALAIHKARKHNE